jgi:hypothetical protein
VAASSSASSYSASSTQVLAHAQAPAPAHSVRESQLLKSQCAIETFGDLRFITRWCAPLRISPASNSATVVLASPLQNLLVLQEVMRLAEEQDPLQPNGQSSHGVGMRKILMERRRDAEILDPEPLDMSALDAELDRFALPKRHIHRRERWFQRPIWLVSEKDASCREDTITHIVDVIDDSNVRRVLVSSYQVGLPPLGPHRGITCNQMDLFVHPVGQKGLVSWNGMQKTKPDEQGFSQTCEASTVDASLDHVWAMQFVYEAEHHAKQMVSFQWTEPTVEHPTPLVFRSAEEQQHYLTLSNIRIQGEPMTCNEYLVLSALVRKCKPLPEPTYRSVLLHKALEMHQEQTPDEFARAIVKELYANEDRWMPESADWDLNKRLCESALHLQAPPSIQVKEAWSKYHVRIQQHNEMQTLDHAWRERSAALFREADAHMAGQVATAVALGNQLQVHLAQLGQQQVGLPSCSMDRAVTVKQETGNLIKQEREDQGPEQQDANAADEGEATNAADGEDDDMFASQEDEDEDGEILRFEGVTCRGCNHRTCVEDLGDICEGCEERMDEEGHTKSSRREARRIDARRIDARRIDALRGVAAPCQVALTAQDPLMF